MHAEDIPGWDRTASTRSPTRCLHGEEAPEPDPYELPATGARLRWVRSQGPPPPRPGLEHADLVVDGETVGQVEVVWEVDPFRSRAENRESDRSRWCLRLCRHPGSWRSRRRSHPRASVPQAGARIARRSRTVLMLTHCTDFASDRHLAAWPRRRRVALDRSPRATPWSGRHSITAPICCRPYDPSALPAATAGQRRRR